MKLCNTIVAAAIAVAAAAASYAPLYGLTTGVSSCPAAFPATAVALTVDCKQRCRYCILKINKQLTRVSSSAGDAPQLGGRIFDQNFQAVAGTAQPAACCLPGPARLVAWRSRPCPWQRPGSQPPCHQARKYDCWSTILLVLAHATRCMCSRPSTWHCNAYACSAVR